MQPPPAARAVDRPGSSAPATPTPTPDASLRRPLNGGRRPRADSPGYQSRGCDVAQLNGLPGRVTPRCGGLRCCHSAGREAAGQASGDAEFAAAASSQRAIGTRRAPRAPAGRPGSPLGHGCRRRFARGPQRIPQHIRRCRRSSLAPQASDPLCIGRSATATGAGRLESGARRSQVTAYGGYTSSTKVPVAQG